MPRPYLSVIIPAFNEATRLPLTLIDIDRHLSAQNFVAEIIVVLSPSSDNSAEILKRFQSIIKYLTVITLIDNRGKGFAIREGMAKAKGAYRLTMDADNSTAIIEFVKMLPYLHPKTGEGYDVVIGSRFLPGSQLSPTPTVGWRLARNIGALLSRLFFVKQSTDLGCGFKCFSAHAADQIFPKCVSDGHAIEAEMIARAQRLGFTIKEIPVFWSHDNTARRHEAHRGSFLQHLRLWWRLTHEKPSLSKK